MWAAVLWNVPGQIDTNGRWSRRKAPGFSPSPFTNLLTTVFVAPISKSAPRVLVLGPERPTRMNQYKDADPARLAGPGFRNHFNPHSSVCWVLSSPQGRPTCMFPSMSVQAQMFRTHGAGPGPVQAEIGESILTGLKGQCGVVSNILHIISVCVRVSTRILIEESR